MVVHLLQQRQCKGNLIMTTKHFTANVISATKVVPDGNFGNSAASGVWDLSEQYDLRKGGNWPETGNSNPADLGLYLGTSNSGNPNFYGDSIRSYSFSSLGSSSDFGDSLSEKFVLTSALASTTRAVFGGGSTKNPNSSFSDVMQYVTILTAGNSTDFGNLTVGRQGTGAHSNSTRGIFGSGQSSGGRSNVMDYITIANTGNATDFGDLSSILSIAGGTGSSTRAIFAGGLASSSQTAEMQYVTIASTGNATNFGSLSASRQGIGGCSSATRAVFAGGTHSSNGNYNTIEYVTIDTTGDSTDFGDLTSSQAGAAAGTSNGTIGVYLYSTFENSITIASTGNGTAFTDSSVAHDTATTSGGHGGLQ
jgi:hypothetical protein